MMSSHRQSMTPEEGAAFVEYRKADQAARAILNDFIKSSPDYQAAYKLSQLKYWAWESIHNKNEKAGEH
jgi:hypothetical protein